MDKLILKKDNLKNFLKALSGTKLIAPVRENTRTFFREIENLEKAEFDLDDYSATPKKVMFPQTETIFAFRHKDDGLDMEEFEATTETVVFGIRPCDAKSFVILDPLFKKDAEDPYYAKRRNAAVLIGLSCKNPTNRCFCPSLGGSPNATEGLDILFTDIGEEFFVEPVSAKGTELIETTKNMFSNSDEGQKKRRDKAAQYSLSKIKRHVDLKGMHEMLPRVFKDSAWKELGNKCIGCGICTYNCPTCHCFDIQDEGTEVQGRRVRVWDACMYPEFTVHASGENPRPDRSARIRNRIFHKFTYYPENSGYIACVGCGRCIELCPVNEDLIEILNRVRAINE